MIILNVGFIAPVDAAALTEAHEPGFAAGEGLADVRPVPDFNVFFRYNATMPYVSDAVWSLTQMRRWGQIAEPQTDAWFAQTAASVYLPQVYLQAAQMLVDEGLAQAADFPFDSDGYKAATPGADFIDGIPFDARMPNAYIDSLPIGLKSGQTVIGGDVQG